MRTKNTRTTQAGKRNGRNRDKGKEFERQIAVFMRDRLGYANAARSFGQAATGNEAPDVAHTPFWIECGKGRTIRPAAKLKQAKVARDACPNRLYKDSPVVVFSTAGGREEVMVSMSLDDFERLATAAKASGLR